MPRRLLFLAISFGFFVLFGIFTYLVKEDLLTQFDFDATVRLQNNIPRRFDEFFSYFSVLGSIEITSIVLLLLLIVRRRIDGFFIFFGFGAFLVIELFGKIMVDHPGPPYMFARYKSLVDFPTHYVPRPDGAYPSGHSGRTVFLAITFLFLLFSGKKPYTPVKIGIAGITLVFVVIMLVSRVYLGEHWTTDVLGGTLLALSVGFASIALLGSRKKRSITRELKGKNE